MDYLGLALFAEGPTDHRFLQPLLYRLCEDICVSRAARPVEVSPVLDLHSLPGTSGVSRDERIEESARAAASAWRILFIHSDGEGDSVAAIRECVAPAITRVESLYGGKRRCVAVVPVREVEAWAVADGDALREAFGTTLSDHELGVPTPTHLAESIRDPKQTLRQAHLATNPTRSSSRAGHAAFLSALGERVSFDVLRRLPSFAQMERCLVEAMHSLHLLA